MSSAPGRRAVLALMAGMLLVTPLAGCGSDPGGSGEPSAAASPPSSDTTRTIPEWEEADGDAAVAIEAGTYVVPRSAWSVTDFTVTFPEGWTVQYGHVYGRPGDPAHEFGFYAVVVDEVFHDACAPEDESTRTVGPGVDDLIVALRQQLSGAAVSEPRKVRFGGYPATRIDVEVPGGIDLATCRMGPVGLQIWYSQPADKYFVLLEAGTARVYLVDVDGRRQVFLVQVGKAASAADRAELQAVLDSIRIGST